MTFRFFRALPALVPVLTVGAALALSACATRSAADPSAELAKLEADCKARDGVLVQTGRTTGHEALDNVCRLTGGPSDRLRPQT